MRYMRDAERTCWLLQVLGLVACLCPWCQAQIYQFDQEPVPGKISLRTMYAFYVFSHKDAPEKTMGQPFVKFHSLVSSSVSDSQQDADLQAYEGIQLCVLPYLEFQKLIEMKAFCSTGDDVQKGIAEKPDQLKARLPGQPESLSERNVYKHTIHFPPSSNWHPKDEQMSVLMTGVYILVWSNCGEFYDAKVSGSVIVKNAYGFLPGNEYHKMPFYGWISVIYTMLALLWMGLCLYWWRELFHIHYCVAVVILLGLFECFLWWLFFNAWNHSGLRGGFLFTAAILSSTVKSIFSYMLVLVASLGWGVTRPYLDHQIVLKVQAVSFVYILLDFIRGAVFSFRHSHSLSLSFVFLCLLPVALLNGGIFYWIFTALSSLMDTLRERRQMEKLAVFERLWKLLVFALTVASVTLIFLMCDLSRSISIRWHYQWFLTDGVSHILFLMVLAAMMYLWAPHMNSQRYAYSHQSASAKEKNGDKKDMVEDWGDEAGEEAGEEDDSFWASAHGQGDTPTVLKALPPKAEASASRSKTEAGAEASAHA